MRESRKTRGASRSRSNPVRYQRPCHEASPHGWTRAGADLALRRRCGSRRRWCCWPTTAFLTGSKAGSLVPSARLDADERVAVALDACGLELAQRLGGGTGQRGVRPGAAGEAEDGQLVRLEVEVGQGVVALVDAVADLVVPGAADVLGGQRDAELAQLVLVPLEHPVEGLVAGRLAVLRDDAADPRLAQGSPGVEQAEHEVEQALGLGRGAGGGAHAPDATRRRPASRG